MKESRAFRVKLKSSTTPTYPGKPMPEIVALLQSIAPVVSPTVLNQMSKAGLLGRKAGRGYYLHDKSRKDAKPNPGASAYVKSNSARTLSRRPAFV